MKKVLMLMITLMTAQSFAVEVKSARLDASKKYVLVDFTYSGGCGTHDFEIKMKECVQSTPVQCKAEIIHKTEDFCEMAIASTIVLPLSKRSKNTILEIVGDKVDGEAQPSHVTVQIP